MEKIFNKIVSLLEKIRRDRLYHYMFGLMIGSLCAITFDIGHCSIIVVALIAFMKELFDDIRGSKHDIIDFIYTVSGGFTVNIMILLSLLFIR